MYNYNSFGYQQYPYNNYNPQQMAIQNQYQQQSQNIYKSQPQIQPNFGLQGKVVDSIDVVRATDIPLDREYKLFCPKQWKCNSY